MTLIIPGSILLTIPGDYGLFLSFISVSSDGREFRAECINNVVDVMAEQLEMYWMNRASP